MNTELSGITITALIAAYLVSVGSPLTVGQPSEQIPTISYRVKATTGIKMKQSTVKRANENDAERNHRKHQQEVERLTAELEAQNEEIEFKTNARIEDINELDQVKEMDKMDIWGIKKARAERKRIEGALKEATTALDNSQPPHQPEEVTIVFQDDDNSLRSWAKRKTDHQAPPTTKRCKNQRIQCKHRSNQPTTRRLPQVDAKRNGSKSQQRVTYSTIHKNTLHVVTVEVHQRNVKSKAVKCNVTSLICNPSSTKGHYHLLHQMVHHHLLHQIKTHRLLAVK